jgi:tRNA (cmo5U34)-methyltransferase
MKIRDLFDACATTYDANRPKLIPEFDRFYGTLIEQIPFVGSASFRVLDLGAGTGLLSAMLRKQFPATEILLTDISDEMLSVARNRFKGDNRILIKNRDNRDIPETEKFDLIVSALSVHHLSHEEKGKLYGDCFRALKPGGKFINADQVLGTTPADENYYEQTWQADVRVSGLSQHFLEEAKTRMLEDNNAPLPDQIVWLKNAGFDQVQCWYQRYRFAVFGGRKL